jgi:parvulin-like peptidyl-prolyl isomerase
MNFEMKLSILSLLTLLCFISFGQTLTKKIQEVSSIEEANDFKKSYSEVTLFTVSTDKDTTGISKELLAKKTGDLFSDEQYTYKIVDSKTALSFRASYIYLDGKKLTLKTIDSLRTIIMNKFRSGVTFSELAKQYNMDGNRNAGDLGWFTEGMMVKDFEMAIRKHNKGDIFKIDIPENKWYYVALKTYENTKIKTSTVLKIRRGS